MYNVVARIKVSNMYSAAQNMTYITCEFPERDRGPVSSAVTFTSMSVALVLVAMRIIAFAPNLSLLWWWDDVLVGLATVCRDSKVVERNADMSRY